MKPITPYTPLRDLPEWCTVREVCTYLRLAKNTVYDAVRTGRIASRQFGERKTLIPRAALAAWNTPSVVEERTEAQP